MKSLVYPLGQAWKSLTKPDAFNNKVCDCFGAMNIISIVDEFKGDAFLPDKEAGQFLTAIETFLNKYS